MKTFLLKHRGRVLCTALSLTFLAWHNFPATETSSGIVEVIHAE